MTQPTTARASREDSHQPTCADPESFARGGPTLTGFILLLFFDDGREIQRALKAGHHGPDR